MEINAIKIMEVIQIKENKKKMRYEIICENKGARNDFVEL